MFRFLQRRDRGKTEQAVRKTRQTWLGRVASVLQRSELDQGLWDELEELLISGDVGLATSERLIESVRDFGRYQELPFAGDPQDLLRTLIAKTRVERFELTRPSLHDIFQRIAGREAEDVA